MKHYFIWWISRQDYVGGRWVDNGAWFGPQYLSDREAWRLEFDFVTSNLGAHPYRMFWTGETWQYDTRSNVQMSATTDSGSLQGVGRLAPYPSLGLDGPRVSRAAQCKGLPTENQCRSILPPNQDLRQGEQLVSPNGKYRAVLQPDSNFVIYAGNTPLRAWGQNGTVRAFMQTDGIFALYGPGDSLKWDSGTHGQGGARLVMQDDGNLVVVAANGAALWPSETNGPRVYMPSQGLLPKIGDIFNPNKVVSTIVGRDVTVSVSPADIAKAAQAAISFVPGIGAGINAAIAAGAALANGENITDALAEGAKNALPGGPIARQAFDSGVAAVKAIASGQNIGDAALAGARELLPSEEAKKAFDVGIAIAHGQNVQQAVVQGATSLAGKAVAALAPHALPAALTNITKSLPPEATRIATTLYNRPEIAAMADSEIAKLLKTDAPTVTAAIKTVSTVKPLPRKLIQVHEHTPAAAPKPAAKPLIAVHETSSPKPAPKPAAKPVVATTAKRGAYAPYPSGGRLSDLEAPPHHGGGHHGGGHRGDGHAAVFRGGRGGPGWYRPVEVVTTTETCRVWSNPITIPESMQAAAKVAVGASGGRPTTARGPDGVLYLFALEKGTLVGRACTAFS